MSYLDTRDLDKRRDELKEEREGLDSSRVGEQEAIREIETEIEEIDEIESYCEDFIHGGTLIPERDFEDYAREFAEDIGAIGDDQQWPNYCIDWRRAARDLSMDYSLVEYQGVDYYVR